MMSYYIESIKYYSDHSRWLAKLFLQFCHEYKCQCLMFESNVMARRERFDWLVFHPASISDTVTFFETQTNLLEHLYFGEKKCTQVFFRCFMWRYFLIKHQKYIPQYYKYFVGTKQLVSEMKKDGTRNDKRLENIFKILSISNE